MSPLNFETTGRFSAFRFEDFSKINLYESKLYLLELYESKLYEMLLSQYCYGFVEDIINQQCTLVQIPGFCPTNLFLSRF